MITDVETLGRRQWRKVSGYHQQARAENASFRYKTIIGGGLRARSGSGRAVEANLACNLLNRMTWQAQVVCHQSMTLPCVGGNCASAEPCTNALLDGTRAYLHAVVDNYSRRILAWRVANRSTAANSVAVLRQPVGRPRRSKAYPMSWPTGGVENVNAQVDALVQAGIVRRLLTLTECSYSNSLIEAGWRSLKHQWLFLSALDSVATVRRLVAFYVDEDNRVIPPAAFRGPTPDEMYFGADGPETAELPSRMPAARAARLKANRAACCPVCPALGAAG